MRCTLWELPRCTMIARSTGLPCRHVGLKQHDGRCHYHQSRPKVHGRHTKLAKARRKEQREQITQARKELKELAL